MIIDHLIPKSGTVKPKSPVREFMISYDRRTLLNLNIYIMSGSKDLTR